MILPLPKMIENQFTIEIADFCQECFVLLTSIELDGTMNGGDLDLIKLVSDGVDIPVIASGGAGNYEHFYQAFDQGGASAVAATSIFHFTERTPMEAKAYLAQKGVPVRNYQHIIQEVA